MWQFIGMDAVFQPPNYQGPTTVANLFLAEPLDPVEDVYGPAGTPMSYHERFMPATKTGRLVVVDLLKIIQRTAIVHDCALPIAPERGVDPIHRSVLIQFYNKYKSSFPPAQRRNMPTKKRLMHMRKYFIYYENKDRVRNIRRMAHEKRAKELAFSKARHDAAKIAKKRREEDPMERLVEAPNSCSDDDSDDDDMMSGQTQPLALPSSLRSALSIPEDLDHAGIKSNKAKRKKGPEVVEFSLSDYSDIDRQFRVPDENAPVEGYYREACGINWLCDEHLRVNCNACIEGEDKAGLTMVIKHNKPEEVGVRGPNHGLIWRCLCDMPELTGGWANAENINASWKDTYTDDEESENDDDSDGDGNEITLDANLSLEEGPWDGDVDESMRNGIGE